MQLGAVLGREGDIGQHVVLAVVHQSAELGPAWPQLIGDVAPGLLGGRGIGLQKGLTDRGGDHGVLALRHVRQGVAHPMNSAPLPCRTEHPGNRMAQAVVWANMDLTAHDDSTDDAARQAGADFDISPEAIAALPSVEELGVPVGMLEAAAELADASDVPGQTYRLHVLVRFLLYHDRRRDSNSESQ